ncbi:MAG TPA: GNAT family N-acetyltransferase [Gemmatimonadaceae bacterium]|nr:GNAT family N-acetyltransferase [Gemmatimonadaceae bacterium]
MTSVTIRAALATDAVRLSGLFAQLGYPAPPEELPARLALLADADNAVLVAVDGDGAAVALISLHRIPALHHARPNCYITALVVDESWRDAGVGRRLLAAAEAWARAHGCRRMSVTSAERRDDAHRFYEACGFPYTGRRFARTFD